MFYFNLLTMKTILFFTAIIVASSFKSQIVEEKILDDGTHQITIIPRHYTKEELAQFKPRRIPSTQEVKDHPTLLFSNSCVEKLETELAMIPTVDSTLASTTKSIFEDHVGILNNASDESEVSYHQIWTLSHSTGQYVHEGLSESFIKMLSENRLQNHFGENPTFFCQEYQYNDKYYLVAVLDK
jgi:hypothetical protein